MRQTPKPTGPTTTGMLRPVNKSASSATPAAFAALAASPTRPTRYYAKARSNPPFCALSAMSIRVCGSWLARDTRSERASSRAATASQVAMAR